MALVSSNIPNLFNGISQQPATLRNPTQGEEQVNALSSVAKGLQKRPPFQHLAKIGTTPLSGAFIHTINLNSTDRFVVVITSASIKVYDLNGVEKTVNVPNGTTYLTATDPKTAFDAVTIADYTVIANKNTVTAMSVDLTPGTLKGTKQLFSDLPTTGNVNGDIWEIAGDTNQRFDSFYVKWVSAELVWRETVKPGITHQFNPATMPHKLTKNTDGTFTFAQAVWDSRLVGDTDSAPTPSFIGLPVSGVFFSRSRLGMIAKGQAVLSATKKPFTFWRESATVLGDADPIDLGVSHVKVSELYAAVPFNRALLLFSDQTQFMLHSNSNVLTVRTGVIDSTTEFESSKNVKPVGAGPNVYFAVAHGSSTGLREYFVDVNNIQQDASNISAHCPTLIPEGAYKIAASANEDTLLVLSSVKANRIYVYRYFWVDDTKVQSSWSYWELDSTDTILNVDFLGDTIVAVISRSDGIYIEKALLSGDAAETAMGFNVFLDRRVSLTGVYDSAANTTTWTLPYSEANNMQVVLSQLFTGRKGELVTITRPSNTTVRAVGNLSANPVYLGRKYTMRYKFSEQFLREEKGGAKVAITDGRLQLRNFSITFADTNYFEAKVTPLYGTSSSYKFTGKVLGTGSMIIGTPPIVGGTFSFMVGARSSEVTIEIINDSAFPSSFLSADWEAFYYSRSARV